MSLHRWKKLSGRTLYKNPYWEYRLDSFELPNGGEGEYHFVHSYGSSMIIPRIEDDRYVLVRQYRYLNDEESLEFPAGGVKEGSDALTTAIEELAEEAGYRAETLSEIGRFNPFKGVTNEVCSVFLAEGLISVEARPDRTEQFEIVTLSAREIDERIAGGELWDGMSLASWMIFQRHDLR